MLPKEFGCWNTVYGYTTRTGMERDEGKQGKLGTTESYARSKWCVVHEAVTLGVLHALKGVGSRAFYRWLVIVRMATKAFALFVCMLAFGCMLGALHVRIVAASQ